MFVSKFNVLCLAALAMGGAAQSALAYEAGDWLVRGRIITVSPNDDSGNLYANGGTLNLGEGVKVNADTVPELDITYMMTPHWGVELILG
jgi:outer membrane protein